MTGVAGDPAGIVENDVVGQLFGPGEELDPYRKYQTVSCPFGVTTPFSTADVSVTPVAASV